MGIHWESRRDTSVDEKTESSRGDAQADSYMTTSNRRLVSWKEYFGCPDQLSTDANSLSFEVQRCHSDEMPKVSSTDVLRKFMKRKKISEVESLDFLYEGTSSIVKKLCQDGRQRNRDLKKGKQGSLQIFDMLCTKSTQMGSTLVFCDDTSVSYPNSGIVATTFDFEKVSQSAARNALKSSNKEDSNPKSVSKHAGLKVPEKKVSPNVRIPKKVSGNCLHVDHIFGNPITVLDHDVFIKSVRCVDWQTSLLLKGEAKRIYDNMGAYSCPLNTYSAMYGYITAKEQWADNSLACSHITPSEQRLQEKLRRKPIGGCISSIPIFRAATTTRLKYPFGTCDGIAWPVVQPYDGINIQDRKEIINCDAVYQMSNLSCYSHNRQEMFICATDNDRWRTEFNVAKNLSDRELLDAGRFKWRIGYKRMSCELDYETLKKNHLEQEQLEYKWLGSLSNDLVYEVDQNELLKLQNAEASCQSRKMSKHVEFHLVDEFSSSIHGGGRNKLTPPEWVTSLESSYVPALDRGDRICAYVNTANKDIYQYMKLLQFPQLACGAIIVKDAFRAAFSYQTRSSLFLCSVKSEDMSLFSKRHKDISELVGELRNNHSSSLTALLRNFILREYEYSNWTIIWDSLATAFRNYPMVSQMLPLLKGEISTTFRRICNLGNRRAYFKSHAEWKKILVEQKKKADAEEEQREAASRESCTKALRVFS